MFVPKDQQIAVALNVLEALELPRNWFPGRDEFVAHSNLELYSRDLIERGIGYNNVLATVSLLHALLIFRNAGMPIFIIKPELAKLLGETDLPDLSLELLKLPFEGICIEVPRGTFLDPAEETQQIFVTQCPGDRFRVVFCGKGSTTHFITIETDASAGTIRAAVELTKEKARNEKLPEEFAQSLRENRAYEDYFKSDIFVFTVNAVLYISSLDADVVEDRRHIYQLHQQLQGMKQGHKRRLLEEKLRQEKQHRIYICGANLKAPKEYFAPLTKEARQLTVRFRVRGHWRNQACGPKLSEHKLIWIQPYWKGPTYAEMLARNYVVNTKAGEE